ncbi:MAG: hypothetical protein U0872_14225 [Planctomycetaceae bacterium]
MLDGQRWFPVLNTEPEAVPPFSIVEIFDGDDDEGFISAKIRKPTGTSGAILALTGPLKIAAYSSGTPAVRATGMATRDGPAWMAYDSDDGAPTNGESYGAKADFWVGKPGISDLLVVGAPQTDVTPKRVLVIFPGGGNCPPSNAIWCIGLVGLPGAGSLTFTYKTNTITIPYGTSVSGVQALVNAVTSWNGNITVSGSITAYSLEFKNDFGNKIIPASDIAVNASGLLGHGTGALPYLIQQGRS